MNQSAPFDLAIADNSILLTFTSSDCTLLGSIWFTLTHSWLPGLLAALLALLILLLSLGAELSLSWIILFYFLALPLPRRVLVHIPPLRPLPSITS